MALTLVSVAPGFGKTADPFVTYTVVSLAALPFACVGLIFSFLVQASRLWKSVVISIAFAAVLFISWPVLAMLLLMIALKGPINPG
ncbi:MAG: hypothetical protein IAE97_13695 [Chthoniobacterales bacterium]|nr:hypothetical protein [Chthoniobacterales bacterium]